MFSGVLQGFVLGPTLFKTFTRDLQKKLKRTLIIFTANKFVGNANRKVDRAIIGSLGRLETWTGNNKI